MEALVSHLEVLALANLDPRIHFAILGDFPDAPTPRQPEDETVLAAARAGVAALNARPGAELAHRFFLFHRERTWNESEGIWMGWERKRGKLEQLNRLLRGATDSGLEVLVGDAASLTGVRYCITLDADTLLPRDAARTLVGIAEHPLNRPVFAPSLRRVVDGYGILQPRVSVTMASAAGSLFARLWAGHTGVDPYTSAVSDAYQDLFGEGIFTGKGLYDVDAFAAALEGRVPENALLSHDLFEGLYARTALVSDVELVDDFPSSMIAHSRRQHRWVRGDWQILLWLFPWVPTRGGGLERNRLPLIARWKILDNLRRSLVPPATVLLLLLAWTCLPGQPSSWTAAILTGLAFPAVVLVVEALLGARERQPLPVLLRLSADELATALARAGLQLVFLASQAAEMAHAIAVTLVRLLWTQRRLLEWETAAATARRAERLNRAGARAFVVAMAASPAFALASTALVTATRPAALPVALPVLVLWLGAPWLAWLLSRPAAPPRRDLGVEDRRELQLIAAATWRYFSELGGAEHHGLPPDNFQEVPEPRLAARTSPTNIGMGLLATLAAHDLGLVPREELVERIDATLTTLEALELHDGHLLNWYDTRSLAPLAPRYVSTVDSGNLAACLLALAGGLREVAREAPRPMAEPASAVRLNDLAARAARFAEGMNFRFLYDRERRIFSVGYRLADAEGPGRIDTAFYDLLASEARLASFVAIAKGDVPQAHWFHLGRLVTSVEGAPTLLSWSATLFEYLMPLLVLRSYPETLLDQSCRMAVRAQVRYGARRGVPWGISESAFNVVDRHDNYQYKAFGVPGLGLKRGLGDELVVAPYATALAAIVDPREAAQNFRRLAALGLGGEYGFYESIDYTHGGDPAEQSTRSRSGTVVRAYFAHHQGMTLVALANVLIGDRMVDRFHADPRVRATELLLQERVPHRSPITQPRPVEETRVAPVAPAVAQRRLHSPQTQFPHTQFLSNGNYTAVVTNAGGGASFCRGRAVTRCRRDATRDPGGQYLYLRDVRSGAVWSAAHHPVGRAAEEYRVTFQPEKAIFRRRDDDIVTKLEIAVSTEDDVEVRRVAVNNQGDRSREIEVTSYAEIVLAPPADDLAHPAFGKLLVESEYVADCAALLFRRRSRSADEAEVWGVHVLALDGRPQGPVEWETDRAQFLGRGRDVDDPEALDGRSLGGTTGAVLDPIASLRQRLRVAAGGFGRISFATGMAESRETALALAHKYCDPSAVARTFALAYVHGQSGLRHLGITSDEAILFERLASRVLGTDGSLRAEPEVLARNELGQSGVWPHGISGDLPILLLRASSRRPPAARAPGAPGPGVLATQGPRRRPRHPQRASRSAISTRCTPRSRRCSTTAPGARGNIVPAALTCCAATHCRDAERMLLVSIARAVLNGDRGELAQQLAHPDPEPRTSESPALVLRPGAPPTPTEAAAAEPEPPQLVLENPFGGFATDGREYVIHLEGDGRRRCRG